MKPRANATVTSGNARPTWPMRSGTMDVAPPLVGGAARAAGFSPRGRTNSHPRSQSIDSPRKLKHAARVGTVLVMTLSLAVPMIALLMTGASSAYAQTLECATVSKGGGVLPDGSIGIIGQPMVGSISNAQYTIEVGIVACLAAIESCVPASPPIAETLADTPLQSPLAGGTSADATGLPVNAKNRFASIMTADAGREQAIRVRFVDLPSPFTVWNGMDFYAGMPREVCENSGKGLETAPQDCPSALPTDTFWAAPLLCAKETAHYMDWRGRCDGGVCAGGLNAGEGCIVDDDCVEVVHFYHEGLVPGGIYDIQVIDNSCSLQDEGGYSAPLTMIQARWGDVCGPGPGGACSGVADGTVDVTNDVLGVLDKFANINELQKARADLEPGDDGANNSPDFKVNVANDVLYCLDAFTGAPYPFVPGDPCRPG